MNAVVTHLWTSTAVLLVALIAARFLPLSARTRYAVLLCGLFKFALPATVVTAPLHAIFDRESVGTIAIAWLDSRMPIGPLTPSASSNWICKIATWAIAGQTSVTTNAARRYPRRELSVRPVIDH